MMTDKKGNQTIKEVGELEQKLYIPLAQAKTEEDPILSMFKKRLDSKEVFQFTFPMKDGRSNLYAFEGGYKIIMTQRESGGTKAEVKVGKTYSVMVKRIEEAEKAIFVSAKMVAEGSRKELEKIIKSSLDKNEHIKIPARVISSTGYDKTNNVYAILLVDIAGLGIVGAIKLTDWSTCFTSSFTEAVAKPGDVLDVVITGTYTWNSGTVYACSRKATIGFDPWSNIEERVPKNTTVCVRCVCKQEKKFFGKIEGVDELNVYCEYPDDPSIYIEEEREYIGHVAKVSEEKKLLRVRIDSALE